MTATRVRTAGVMAVAMTMSLVAAACSGDDDSSTTTTPTTVAVTAGPEPTGASTTAPATPGFKFGFLQPSAGLGAELATAQTSALQLAVDDINTAGGVNGVAVGVVTVNEGVDPTTSVTELVAQGANVLVGPIGSTVSKEILGTLADEGIITCSASATSQELTTLDTANVFYRTILPDAATVAFTAEQITTRAEADGAPSPYHVSILARHDDYGVNVATGLAGALQARGIEATVQHYNPLQVLFQSNAEIIADEDPSIVVLVSYEEGVRAVSALVAAGVPSDRIMGLDGLFNPLLATNAFPTDPEQANGLQVVGSTGNRAFIDRLMAVPGQRQVVFGAQMYDCAVSLALAADAAESTNAEAIAPFLTQVTNEGRPCTTYQDCLTQMAAGEDIDYSGVSGAIRFDEAGDATESRFTLAEFAGGALTEVTSQDLDLEVFAQEEALASAVLTARLQQVLKALGFYSGPIDGVYGPETVAAVEALQESLGVPVTGYYDEATDAALHAKYGDITTGISDATKSIQLLLTDLGLYDGPIDGIYGQETVDAVKALQAQLGVPQTGVIDGPTLAAAYAAGLSTGGTPPSTTAPSTTRATTTTTASTTVAPTVPDSTTPGSTTPDTTTTTVPETTTTSTVPPTTVPPPDPDAPTMFEFLSSDPRFTTYVDLLVRAGITDDANFLGPYTMFAPTNDAFAKLPPEDLAELRADPGVRRAFIAYQIVPDVAYTVQQLSTLNRVPTVYGASIRVAPSGSTVILNDVARVIEAATVCLNGNVMPIDTTLTPPPS